MLIDIDKEIEYYEEKIKKINQDCHKNNIYCDECQESDGLLQFCPMSIFRDYIKLLEEIKRDEKEVDKIIKNGED